MDKEKLKSILIKANNLQKGKELAYAKEFISIDEKIDTVSEKADKIAENVDTKLSNISEELKKKLELELNYEVDEEKIVDSVLSKVKIPKDGKDYILTDKDKKEIASFIKVPEKVIEKTEVIRETPIITNEIKEVAIADSAEIIADKLESLKGDDRLDKKAIKGLEDLEKQVSSISSRPIISGGITQARVLQLISENTATFETVSKNILSYPYVPTYLLNGLINYITYTVGTGTIVKTYNYSGNLVSSIVLSGDTPAGISLTKTFNYTGSVLTSITYS